MGRTKKIIINIPQQPSPPTIIIGEILYFLTKYSSTLNWKAFKIIPTTISKSPNRMRAAGLSLDWLNTSDTPTTTSPIVAVLIPIQWKAYSLLLKMRMEKMAEKTMRDPLNIMYTEAYVQRSPIADRVVANKSHKLVPQRMNGRYQGDCTGGSSERSFCSFSSNKTLPNFSIALLLW